MNILVSKAVAISLTALSLLAALALMPSSASAFKIGTEPQPMRDSHDDKIDLLGDPIHEDMVWESISLARKAADLMVCTTSDQAISNYLDLDSSRIRQHLSHGLCCHEGARSRVCDSLETEGKWPDFHSNVPPIISGVRWNDDVCHMSYDDRTRTLWAVYWMNGFGVKRFNNGSFSSHFHEQQFLHAMAPASIHDPSEYRLTTRATQQRIDMWAELAFKVAEGKIPSNSSLKKALEHIDPEAKKSFDLSFTHQERTLSFLFTGLDGANDGYIRQMAMGALLHTVQDSFSSSHVERESEDRVTLQPRVKSKGGIRKFHTYGIQSPSRHGHADHRPVDLSDAEAADFHPVSLGAQLLACAVEGASADESKWPEAKPIIDRIFAKSAGVGNCASNAGRAYVAQGQSDMPDLFLLEGTVEPTHCRW